VHWEKITDCIEYKLLSIAYKVFTATLPLYAVADPGFLQGGAAAGAPSPFMPSLPPTLSSPPHASYLPLIPPFPYFIPPFPPFHLC